MLTGKKIISSSFLLVIVRLLQRTLGLISTLILARILVPQDFGIVAMTAISLQFAEVLSNSGIKQYIPQKDQVDDTDVNTAWTIDLCLKFVLWMVLLGIAPYLGDFYNNKEMVNALQVVSIVIFLRAIQNPGLHLLRRNLEYKKIFWLTLFQKIISFCAVISIALVTESYWAMIVGDILYAFIGVVGSYFIISYRPKLSLDRGKEQWDFSKWLLSKGVVGFFRAQIDQLMVSKIYGISDLGAYNLVRSIAILPAADVIVPAVEPLLASFARVNNNIVELGHQLRASLLLILLLITPICIFLVMFQDVIVLVLLGEKWANYGALLANLSILLFTFAIGAILGQFYLAIGKVKLVFFYNLLSLIFIMSFLLLFSGDSIDEFALNRGILGIISTFLWLMLALYFSKSKFFKFLLLMSPVIIAALISSYIVTLCDIQLSLMFMQLFLSGLLYMILYILIITVFYIVVYHQFAEWGHLKKLMVESLIKIKLLPEKR